MPEWWHNSLALGKLTTVFSTKIAQGLQQLVATTMITQFLKIVLNKSYQYP